MSVKPFWRVRAFEFVELVLVQQEFAGAQVLVVHGVAVGEGADVGVEQEAFAVFEQAVGVLEVGLAFADAFDLGAAEGDAGLELVGEEVVVAGGAVEGGVALAGGDGVAVFLLDGGLWRGGGSGRVGEGAGHGVVMGSVHGCSRLAGAPAIFDASRARMSYETDAACVRPIGAYPAVQGFARAMRPRLSGPMDRQVCRPQRRDRSCRPSGERRDTNGIIDSARSYALKP